MQTVVCDKKIHSGKAIVKKSFKVAGSHTIVELQHYENGLPRGTELVSEKSGLVWSVAVRVLFPHAAQLQRVFVSESTQLVLPTFKNQAQRSRAIDGIKKREAQHIFQYSLHAVGHDEKPEEGEIVRISIAPQQR